MNFSNKNRADVINKAQSQVFDLLIIGGGITGAGIALDAITRGYNPILFEQQDFAGGTSSRSTKLVHGGLRYLKQLQIGVVAEVGKERSIVYENGPHVTKPEWMLLPFHKGGTFGRLSTSIGLRLYDFLAGVKKDERRLMLNREETIRKAPLIRQEGLSGGGYYVEYQTDDARLTIEVIKEAVDQGALALNYSAVEELLYADGKIVGATVKDILTNGSFRVHAKKIVNATGPWVDTIRELDHSKSGKYLRMSKGIHLVFDQSRFPLKQAIYFDSTDGRMIFAIPREGKTYVGTTDTFYNDNPIHPRMTNEDRNYVINTINNMFPNVAIKKEDIESSWAGIRPLISQEGKAPSEISRKDEVWVSKSGLITIAGGKLTGYRRMAETVVDRVGAQLAVKDSVSVPRCQTKQMPISGGHVGGSTNFKLFVRRKIKDGIAAGLTEKEAVDILQKYGSNAPILFDIAQKNKVEANHAGLPLAFFVRLLYAIEHEMAYTPLDFFHRRTGMLLFSIDTVRKWKDRVLDYMAVVFSWSEAQLAQFSNELNEELRLAVEPID